MTAYFIRRFLLIIPTFLGITILVFMVTRFVPGGPIERMISAMQNRSEGAAGGGGGAGSSAVGHGSLSADQMKELEHYYGFDKPVLLSYFEWLKKIVQLDLGVSTRYNEPVWDIIKSRFPISIFYGLTTLVLTYLVCIPLGVWKAIRHSSYFDNISSGIIFVGYAIPNYVIGVALLLLFASRLELFPMGGFHGSGFEELSTAGKIRDILHHAALPLLTYMAGSFAFTTFLMKNSLLDNLAADYVRTAIAKGLPFRKAVTGHALRNSLIPLATHFGGNLSSILMGSFLVETIYNIDGFGLLGYESLVERDYPVVLGTMVISSLLFLLGNILSDVCVALVDPRVKFQ